MTSATFFLGPKFGDDLSVKIVMFCSTGSDGDPHEGQECEGMPLGAPPYLSAWTLVRSLTRTSANRKLIDYYGRKLLNALCEDVL